MDIKKQSDQKKVLAYTVVFCLVITFCSSLSSIYLIYQNKELTKQLLDNKQTIISPMVNLEKEFSFYGDRGDARYLRSMAISFLSLRLNVSAQNVEQSHEILLSYSSDDLRAKLIEVLSKEKKSLMVDNGASAFYVKEMKVNPNSGLIDVVGDVEFYYGIKKIEPIRKHYQLKIEMRNSQLKLTNFVEIHDEK